MVREHEPVTDPHDPGLLAAYAEDRLDAEERRAFTSHLAACAPCRQALAMLARAPGLDAIAARRPRAASPAWLAVAATIVLAILVVRRTEEPVALDRPPAPPATLASSAITAPPATIEVTPRAPVATPDPLLDPGLLVKRGTAPRQVGHKSFRLRAGEWVDADFDSTAALPTTLIKGSDERAAALERLPALGPYAELGDRVVVVVDGSVYRFTP